MLNFIYGIISCFVVIVVFTLVRRLIIYRLKDSLKINTSESFKWEKFISGFALFDLKLWAKSFHILWRHLIIFAIIFSCVFGYGYWSGRRGKPVEVDLAYEKEFTIQPPKNINGYVLYKPKNSYELVWKDIKTGKIVGKVKVKDIPELQKKLKPYGFILKPIGVLGYGLGDKNKFEGGAGLSFLKYFKWRLESFLTNMGIYLGSSYKITDNSGLGIGVGKGYKGDNRVLFYYKWEF